MRPSASVSPLADQLVAAVELDPHALGRAGRRRCRGRGSRRSSLRESSRLRAVLLGDLRLVGADEVPVADDLLAARRSSRSTRCGPAKTRFATGSTAPPASSPSVAQTARSARLPGSSEPMSSRPSTAAPPRVPRRIASRAVIAPRPPRPRAQRSACLTSRNRSPRSFDAEPSTPRPTRTPASSSSRVRRDAGAEPHVRGRAVRDADALLARRSRCPRRRGGRSARTRRRPSSQPTSARYSTGGSRRARGSTRPPRRSRRGACAAEPEPARLLRRLGHQPLRHRERRARRGDDLHEAVLVLSAAARSMSARIVVQLLDDRVGRQAALRRAEVHRAARGDDPQAELARRAQLRVEDRLRLVREQVVVVEDGRAARERELGEPVARGRVLRLRVEPRPDRVALDEPLEERPVLRAGARQVLPEVVVRVDEPGRDDGAAEVDPLVGDGRLAGAGRGDEAVLESSQPSRVLGAGVVHRHDPAAVSRTLSGSLRCHPATP